MARTTVAQLEERLNAYHTEVKKLDLELKKQEDHIDILYKKIEETYHDSISKNLIISKMKEIEEERSKSWLYRLFNLLGKVRKHL